MGIDALMQDAFIDEVTGDLEMDSTPTIQECVEIDTQHPMPPISKLFKYF